MSETDGNEQPAQRADEPAGLTDPIPGEPVPAAPAAVYYPPAQPPEVDRHRWWHHLAGVRATIAVAVASLIVGGLAGAAISQAADDDPHPTMFMRSPDGGPGQLREGGPPGFGGGTQGLPPRSEPGSSPETEGDQSESGSDT